ncbi:hypothetical protein GCM10023169_22980 [Georgenia halophila]|uniref:Uncharacterized protein n=1 Tax=Georgenia halophila TaxID=620889 RepID=A0ABP8L9F8_9MICO
MAHTVRLRWTAAATNLPSGMKGPPVHPPELTYPCCLPALGEFGKMTPHEGSISDLTDPGATASNLAGSRTWEIGHVGTPADRVNE